METIKNVNEITTVNEINRIQDRNFDKLLSSISDPIILISPVQDNDQISNFLRDHDSIAHLYGLQVFKDQNQLIYWNENFKTMIDKHVKIYSNGIAK